MKNCDWSQLPKLGPWTPTPPPPLKPIQRMWKSETAQNLYQGSETWKTIVKGVDAVDRTVGYTADGICDVASKAFNPLKAFLRCLGAILLFFVLVGFFHWSALIAFVIIFIPDPWTFMSSNRSDVADQKKVK